MSFKRLIDYWNRSIVDPSETSELQLQQGAYRDQTQDSDVGRASTPTNARESIDYFDALEILQRGSYINRDSIASNKYMDAKESGDFDLHRNSAQSNRSTDGYAGSTDWNDVASEAGSCTVIKGAHSDSESETGSFVQLTGNDSRPQSVRLESRSESMRVSFHDSPLTLPQVPHESNDSSNEGSFIHISSTHIHDSIQSTNLPSNDAQSKDEEEEEGEEDDGSDTGSFIRIRDHTYKPIHYTKSIPTQDIQKDSRKEIVPLENVYVSVDDLMGSENASDSSNEGSFIDMNMKGGRKLTVDNRKISLLPTVLTQRSSSTEQLNENGPIMSSICINKDDEINDVDDLSSDTGSFVRTSSPAQTMLQSLSLIGPHPKTILNRSEIDAHHSSEEFMGVENASDSSDEGSFINMNVKERKVIKRVNAYHASSDQDSDGPPLTAENLARTISRISSNSQESKQGGSISSDAGSVVRLPLKMPIKEPLNEALKEPLQVLPKATEFVRSSRPIPMRNRRLLENRSENVVLPPELLLECTGDSSGSSNEGSVVHVNIKENDTSSGAIPLARADVLQSIHMTTELITNTHEEEEDDDSSNAGSFVYVSPTKESKQSHSELHDRPPIPAIIQPPVEPNASPSQHSSLPSSLRPRSKVPSAMQNSSRTFPLYSSQDDENVSASAPLRLSRFDRPNSHSRSRLFVLQSVLDRAKSTVEVPHVAVDEKRHVQFLGKEVSAVYSSQYVLEDLESLYYSDLDANEFKLAYDEEEHYASTMNKTWYEWMVNTPDVTDSPDV